MSLSVKSATRKFQNTLGLSLLLTISLLINSSCNGQEISVKIPANESVEISFPTNDLANAKLKNRTAHGFDVAVKSKKSGTQLRGFGLGPMGKADVTVESFGKLVLTNNSEKEVRVDIEVSNLKPISNIAKDTYISFTLHNTSAQSIPLIIPGVMNPNLNPYSKSGVSLKIGQKLFFKVNGRKYLLLTVGDSISENEILDVPQLIANRKKELGI